jgi:dipeptide transport system permease protein
VENVTGFMMIDSLMPSTIKEYGLVAFYSSIQHIILPVLTMAIAPTAAFIKMTRASMLKTMNEDYIRTAVAKGLTESRIIWIHALRNALIPIITTGGLFFVSAVIGGAIITETIFSWPGIGKYIVSSVHARDYPVIQSAVLLIGLSVIVTNLIVEFLYGIANPKMRKK